MGNRGFLHTTPAPTMPTILLSSASNQSPCGSSCCTTASAWQIPYPLAFVFSHLHSTVLSMDDKFKLARSWLAYKRISELSAI